MAGLLLLLAVPLEAQDVDPPQIRVLESGVDLADGAFFSSAVVPVIEITEASPVSVDATLDASVFVSGSSVSQEGVHELVVSATDDAGNVAELIVGFEIDLTPPVLGAVSPASKPW